MKNLKFKTGEFLASLVDAQDMPIFRRDNGELFSEILIMGKSNVGKSSLINHLLNLKNLAYTSAKPGKTITINFFKIDNSAILIDFPGYGYAKQSKQIKKDWNKNFDLFLNNRKTIKLLLLLVDSRREISTEDLIIYDWAQENNIPCGFIFTKADKLKKNELMKKASSILTFFNEEKIYPEFHIFYSTITKNNKNALISLIKESTGDK